MAKKKETSEPVQATNNFPARYVRQPYPISAMQADLSKQQIRLLIGMMQSIQDGVQRMFERGANTNGQLLLFPELQKDTDTIEIEFKFSDIAVRKDAYSDVEMLAEKFKQMIFRYEDKEKGEITLSNFVYKVVYPKRGSKRDKMRFIFTKEQAEVAFNFTKYSRYLLSVAAEAESKHTARIYMLITSARGFDSEGTGIFHWYVGYEELRRMLGCDEKDEHGHWQRKRQKLYKHFKFNILNVAQSELKQLADDGKADCWFEFVELPEGFTGEPERFDFVVHLTEIGRLDATSTRAIAADLSSKVLPVELSTEQTANKKNDKTDKAFKDKCRRCREMMKQFFQLSEGHARSLTSRATPDNIDGLMAKMEEWKMKLDSGILHWRSVQATAQTSISNYLDDAAQPAIEIPTPTAAPVSEAAPVPSASAVGTASLDFELFGSK